MGTITLNLKNILSEKKITQKELSEKTGLRPATLSAMCGNKLDKVNVKHLSRIMAELDINDFNHILKVEEGSSD